MKAVRVTVAALTTAALVLGVAAPLAAWHPKASIKKEVMNQTTSSALVDANDAGSAVAAKPGDVLKYVITVSNIGDPAQSGMNDMAKTVVTDSLPAGVELTSSASQRKITEDLGLVKPGQSVKKEYLVKVTSTTNGAVITNEACVDGNSTANDNPQHACDKAVVKVNVPEVPQTPTPPTTPITPTTPELPKETPQVLPSTGPEAFLGGALSVSGLAYGANVYLRSKRNLLTAHKR
jgi:uncharacterized repeat protein (TIGR01451 family)